MYELMFRISKISMELNRLLGTRFVPGHPSMDSPLGMSLIEIFNLHNAGNYIGRDLQLLRLEFLLKHLKEIEAASPKLLRKFKREIWRAGSTDGFFGIRFEVNIAASLIRKNIPFKKQESPDFIIKNTNIAIECGSIRIRGRKSKNDYIYKIGACIRNKEAKKYYTSNTSLFIDITNIIYSQCIFQGTLPHKDKIKQAALDSASDSSFGNVTIFSYLFDVENKSLISFYIRADHNDISSELKAFMDSYFPFGNGYISLVGFPAEG